MTLKESPIRVVHLGPSTKSSGGMSSVIRTLVETAPYQAIALDTWRKHSLLSSGLLAARAALRLALSDPASSIAHVHLSERGSFVREGFLAVGAKKRGYATVVTLHGAEFAHWVRGSARARRLAKAVLSHSDAVLVLHDGDREVVKELLPSVRIEVVPNPVDGSPRPVVEQRNGGQVAFVGEKSKRKGLDRLLASWPAVATDITAHLVVAGPPGDVSVPPNLERVTDVGALGYRDARQLIRTSELIVLPSRAEALPMTLIESMAEATPFIGSAVAGIPMLAASGGGVCRDVSDPTELANAITELLNDGDRRRAMGTLGVEWWLATASPASVHQQLATIYEDVLGLNA